MNEYNSPKSDLILKKTNSIIGVKIADFPQYKPALTPEVKLKMNKLYMNQLPNIVTKDNNILQFETINNMLEKNMSYK